MSTFGMLKVLKPCLHWRISSIVNRQHVGIVQRCLCTDSDPPTDGEQKITAILKEKFPEATHLAVHDISGGCGSMYEIQLESAEFKGKRTVLQHRMVNEALKEEIKDMHGLRISTAVPDS